MSDRYVGLYGSHDHAEEEADILRDEGIDLEITATSDLDEPEGSNLDPATAIVAPAALVFPNEEEARKAADFIKVGDITRPSGEMALEGAQTLRA